ncbi:uncharacterized protein [Miscanthus floridulus]|uniref:uncharacterized protein n=1 Tax=Miscanthus floridulus TaxID=154761 RepID=UPI0034583115
MFNSSNSSFCGASNKTLLVYNLTIFYAEADLRGNQAPLVATSVVMFALAVFFVILNIFSRYSDVSATLNPSIRLFFSAALSLFLPAMSYLFSEAKSTSAASKVEDLSVRARIILMWMLLVELLRKKVEAILLTAAGGGTQGYSAMVQRATRVVWLGSLVFFNLRSAGKKSLYGMLWVFVAAKFVQRSVAIEVGKRSFAYGKNPQLVAAYMPPMLELQQEQQPERSESELLRHCNYAVMGEEELIDKNKAGPKGYKLDKHKLKLELEEKKAAAGGDSSAVVTVGRVWRLADSDQLLSSEPRLKRLCLSFALFKLLRRRLEGYPISGAEAADCQRLIFHGLLEEPADTGYSAGEHAFQVFADEVEFLCENYHSVVPVVFASPFFFAHNYVLFPVVVLALCLLVLVLSGNGDVAYAVRSLRCDNFFTSGNVVATARYVLGSVHKSTTFLFCVIDLTTTVLLVLAVAYEEVSEYVVFLFSNWFTVSLLCYHTSGHERRAEAGVLRRVITGVLLLKNTHPALAIKQFSLLWFLGRLPLPSTAVHSEAMKLIMERLANGAALTNGTAALYKDDHLRCVRSDELAWACGGGVAEVMLTWHVATAMLEARCGRRQQHAPPEPGRTAAMSLSGYCAYLVALHPELLPDDKDGTEVLFKEMKKELTKEMGRCGYYGGGEAARCAKLMEMAGRSTSAAAAMTMTVLEKGARLGKVLIERYKEGAREAVWRLLGDLWTEVVVYAAPTAGELHVKSHKEALAQGAELITVLWAITTHTGIARPEEEEQQHPPAPGTV